MKSICKLALLAARTVYLDFFAILLLRPLGLVAGLALSFVVYQKGICASAALVGSFCALKAISVSAGDAHSIFSCKTWFAFSPIADQDSKKQQQHENAHRSHSCKGSFTSPNPSPGALICLFIAFLSQLLHSLKMPQLPAEENRFKDYGAKQGQLDQHGQMLQRRNLIRLRIIKDLTQPYRNQSNNKLHRVAPAQLLPEVTSRQNTVESSVQQHMYGSIKCLSLIFDFSLFPRLF